MRNLIKYLAVLSLLLFLVGCNNDDALYTVNLNESFIAKKGCEYTCVTDDGDVIRVKVTDIDDDMLYGEDCLFSFGAGNSEISVKGAINKEKYSTTFTWAGCDGTAEYPSTMSTLPNFQMEGYVLKMMKLYPLSSNNDGPPKSEKDYEIKLIILN
jgi:hypothetical protein